MSNQLSQETSPYLLQHADNPVAWYPWCQEALDRARSENKPILLSIGYSACHWCHVMAHESFEDASVAELMNRLFINIKVDREERPDLDQIYQLAHQVLTRRGGGWPLTMFLTPEGKPFFGGTYFPKQARYGLPGFTALLERVEEAYRTRRNDIDEQAQQLTSILSNTTPVAGEALASLGDNLLQSAAERLHAQFDNIHGGFGHAPKFPHPTDLALLLRHHMETGNSTSREIVLLTLQRMAEGGIYDQIGGGFCRYSVDERWNIPHFEKMLYDNGPLLGLYADAWQISKTPLFKQVVEDTANWIMREMQSPEGGYYSSLDADSEHVEGKFYVWSTEEIRALLPAENYETVALHFGLNDPPNFEDEHWHLYVARNVDIIANRLDLPPHTVSTHISEARKALFSAREKRIRPGCDDKILTSWNALMIEGMAHAANVFDRSDWLASAQRAADFLQRQCWQEGRLLATTKDGHAHLNAYLDDYAFLASAMLTLAQAAFRQQDIDFAQQLADSMLENFEDREHGGLFFTSHDHEQLIHRIMNGHDNATPSGNGVAAKVLIRLGHLLGETRYLDTAERILQRFMPQFKYEPGGFSALMIALNEWRHPPVTVVLRGDAEHLSTWQRSLASEYLPHVLNLVIPANTTQLASALDKPVGSPVNAWVCTGVNCLAPFTEVTALLNTCRARC